MVRAGMITNVTDRRQTDHATVKCVAIRGMHKAIPLRMRMHPAMGRKRMSGWADLRMLQWVRL